MGGAKSERRDVKYFLAYPVAEINLFFPGFWGKIIESFVRMEFLVIRVTVSMIEYFVASGGNSAVLFRVYFDQTAHYGERSRELEIFKKLD